VTAFSRVAGHVPSARLVLVGSGPLEAALKRQIERLGLTSRVVMAGDVVATTVLPACDVFCLASRYEGMPYVLLEALAAGLPIVATRVGGAATAVEPGENGFLVPIEDAEALTGALLCLARDERLRQRFIAAAKARARSCTVDEMVGQTLAVYQQALGVDGGSRGFDSSGVRCDATGSTPVAGPAANAVQIL
jgi:glycosyltransferase involved in cell wall biosynthesis